MMTYIAIGIGVVIVVIIAWVVFKKGGGTSGGPTLPVTKG